MHVGAGGTACLLCALTGGGLQRIWALAGRFGAASAVGLAQLYLAELLSSDVQHAALAAAAQVRSSLTYHFSIAFAMLPITLPFFTLHHASLSSYYDFQIHLIVLLLLFLPFLISPSPLHRQCMSCVPPLSSS